MAIGRQRITPRVCGSGEELVDFGTNRLLWRKRYEKDGLHGVLADLPRSERPKRITTEREAAIVEATMKTIPGDATHWSIRAMAGA